MFTDTVAEDKTVVDVFAKDVDQLVTTLMLAVQNLSKLQQPVSKRSVIGLVLLQ